MPFSKTSWNLWKSSFSIFFFKSNFAVSSPNSLEELITVLLLFPKFDTVKLCIVPPILDISAPIFIELLNLCSFALEEK